MKSNLLVFVIALVLISCSTHNTPNSQKPNQFDGKNGFSVFVDQDGTYYPENWKQLFGNPPRYNRWGNNSYSLFLRSSISDNVSLEELKEANIKILASFKKDIKKFDRIFILVHGYNNTQMESQPNYNKIRSIIKTDSQKDAIVEFYWDGLAAPSLGSPKIWFNATGYSQLAGQFGLRKILNSIENKEIYMISHSRGASVVLSALSNPRYNPKFIEDTKLHSLDLGKTGAILENNNKIRCIFLAPAVGLVDFWSTNSENNENYRVFSPQLKGLQLTINENDEILQKYMDRFSDKFNPTDLGYDLETFNKLSSNYSFMSHVKVEGNFGHSFNYYIEDESFKEMLSIYKIDTN